MKNLVKFPVVKYLVAGAVVGMSGCSPGVESVEDAAKQADCEIVSYVEDDTTLFQEEEVECSDGRTLLYFPTPEARENATDLLRQFGVVETSGGENWTVYEYE